MRAQDVNNLNSGNRFLWGMKIRGIWWLALACLVIALGVGVAASDRKISGTYFAASPADAFLLVVTQTNGDQLAGRYEHVELQPSGELDDTNETFAGTISNGTVVATLKPKDFLSAILNETITVSGTSDGHTLHLVGGGDGRTLTLDLVKSDESAFRAQLAKLTEQASRIRAQNAAR